MKWLKSFKSSDLLLWKITPWKKPHEQQFAFYNYQHTQALVKNLFNYCPRSERIAQPLSKLIDFSPLPEELYNYKKTETLLIILQNLQFVLSCVWKLTLDQAVVRNLSKLFLFINIGQFLDKKNIMISVDFACDITFYYEASTNVGQINRERKNIFRSSGKPKCIPSNDHQFFFSFSAAYL